MQILGNEVGFSQIAIQAPLTLRIVKNTVIIGTGIIAVFISPMPEGWISTPLKVYVLTVCSGLASFLQTAAIFTGSNSSKTIQQNTPKT